MLQVCRRRIERRAPSHASQSCVRLSLGSIAAEVGYQADPQRVGAVQALDDAQVAGSLRQTLAEAQAAVIHGQCMGIKIACMERVRLSCSEVIKQCFTFPRS